MKTITSTDILILKSFDEIDFANNDDCITLSYSKHLNKFNIWMNGIIFHSCKTVESADNVLTTLIKRLNLNRCN